MTEFLETAPSARQHNPLLRAAHPDWTADHRRRVNRAFHHSCWSACAFVDGILAGTIRVVHDDVSFGVIADLLVHPQYRHQGIASVLVRMARVAHSDFYLYADPQSEGLKPFYEQADFSVRPVWRCEPEA